MPEMRFRVRWPDDAVSECYSPSRAIAEFLTAGQDYPLVDFLKRSRAGLRAASDRVQAMYGTPCSRAAAQLAVIERTAQRFADSPDPLVSVETMHIA